MSRILIVEDEEILAASLKDILEEEGHQTLLAHDGVDALALLERERPDLLLLDVMLPRRDGRAVLGELPRVSPATAVVVVSSCEPALVSDRVPRSRFLQKPFSLDALLAMVRRVLAASLPAPPPG